LQKQILFRIFAKIPDVMETTVKEKPAPKQKKTVVAKPRKRRGGVGFLKGKIHYDDSVFNLGK